MDRTLDEILTDINTRIENNVSHVGNNFYGLAVLQPLDGVTFPMRRTNVDEGKRISPDDTRGLQFYHRVLNQVANDAGGKGISTYYTVTYQMVFVGVGYRPKTTSATTWNNEDLAREIFQVMGQNPVLDNRELLMARGQTVTDKLTVLNQEYAGNLELKNNILRLLAFKIEYTIKQKILGAICIDANSVMESELTAEL